MYLFRYCAGSHMACVFLFGAADRPHMVHADAALHSSTGARLLPAAATAATVAVHVGISWTEYARVAADHSAGPYSAQGAVLSVAPGRVSYHFGLKGPSIAYGVHSLTAQSCIRLSRTSS